MPDIDNRNYYQILGVEPEAPPERIKEVYRDLARAYHPDSNFYDEIVPCQLTPEQEAFFKIATAAYQTLIDDKKRAE